MASKVRPILVGVVTYLALCILLGPVCYQFNQYNLANQEEADRNYSVVQYHALYDSSYHQFQGMNYPYGEQIVFSEGQPILSYSIKFISSIFPRFANYTVGIINFLIVLNIVFAAVFIYLILLGLKVPWKWAFVAAISITLLNPQNIRIPWQYPICPALVIPLSLYLIQKLLNNFNRKSYLFFILITLNVLFWFFINAYLGALSLTISLIGYSYFIFKYRSWRSLTSLIILLAPPLLFIVYLKSTDHHLNRPELSYGYLEYTSSIHSIFSSKFTPFAFIQERIGFDIQNSLRHMEGNGYLGFFGLFNVMLLIMFVSISIKQKVKHPYSVYVFLIVGTLSAIYAIGFPFTFIPSTVPLIEHLGPVKQLRSSGRFIWITYFTFQIVIVYAIYYFHEYLNNKHKLFIKWYFVLFCLLVFVEGGAGLFWAGSKGKGVDNIYNPKLVKKLPEFQPLNEALNVIHSEDYQAILTVPFFHIGSELLRHPASGISELMRHSMAFSVHSGLPLMSSCLGRISRDETIKAFQFYTKPIINKPIKYDISATKPFIILADHTANWTDEEKKLVAKARKVFTKNNILSLYELDLATAFKNENNSIFKYFFSNQDTFSNISADFYALDKNSFCYYESFEKIGNTSKSYRGEKAFAIPPGKKSEIFKSDQFPLPDHADSILIRFWINNETNGADCRFRLKVFDLDDQLVDDISLTNAHTTFWHLDGWSMLQIPIMKDKHHNVELIAHTLSHHYPLIIDDLMVSPKQDTIYQKISPSQLRWNNVDILMN